MFKGSKIIINSIATRTCNSYIHKPMPITQIANFQRITDFNQEQLEKILDKKTHPSLKQRLLSFKQFYTFF